MNWQHYTLYFMCIVTPMIFIYDIIAIKKAGVDASISNIMQTYSHKYPIIAFVWGFLMGHFYG